MSVFIVSFISAQVLRVFRLHQMHEMQTIVTDVSSVCQSVWLNSAALCGGHLVQPLPNHFGVLFA